MFVSDTLVESVFALSRLVVQQVLYNSEFRELPRVMELTRAFEISRVFEISKVIDLSQIPRECVRVVSSNGDGGVVRVALA